ncbi:MAG: TetR/AcrR family transcriptional regulator [Gammaproteobacteria bacterium]|nr:TetR/AcrR family transcriptional regulator [Gammaproteobacteria bacterium]
MQETIHVHQKLSPRKKPSQSRSQKMVKGILDATRNLLRNYGTGEISGITTNHIAREANISVGSLYQYFPNKEAILFELYKEMLGQFSSIMEMFKSEPYLSLSREEFFDRFNRAMKDAEADVEVVFEMHNAVKIYPALAEADRRHAELIAREMAGFMKHFGSRWSMEKLQRLALHAYYINYGTWMYRDHARPDYEEVLDWEISALNFMISKCFE